MELTRFRDEMSALESKKTQEINQIYQSLNELVSAEKEVVQ